MKFNHNRTSKKTIITCKSIFVAWSTTLPVNDFYVTGVPTGRGRGLILCGESKQSSLKFAEQTAALCRHLLRSHRKLMEAVLAAKRFTFGGASP